jgi:hypothetical protein
VGAHNGNLEPTTPTTAEWPLHLELLVTEDQIERAQRDPLLDVVLHVRANFLSLVYHDGRRRRIGGDFSVTHHDEIANHRVIVGGNLRDVQWGTLPGAEWLHTGIDRLSRTDHYH